MNKREVHFFSFQSVRLATGLNKRSIMSLCQLLVDFEGENDPNGCFTFSDVCLLRHVAKLRRLNISLETLGQAKRQIEATNADVQFSMMQLQIYDQRLMTRKRNGELVFPNGQQMLSLDNAETEAYPSSIDYSRDLFELGWQAEQFGDFVQAISSYEKLLLQNGPDPDVCFNLANCLLAVRRFDAAATRFRQVLEMGQDFPEAWNNLGIALSMLPGQRDAAKRCFETALEYDPTYINAKSNLEFAAIEISSTVKKHK